METVKMLENQTIQGKKQYSIPTKLYVVNYQENLDYPEGSWTAEIFGTKEEAEKYSEIHEQLDDSYVYWVEETELAHIDLNAVVKEYYYFCFDTHFKTKEELIEDGKIDTSVDVPGYIDSMVFKLNHPDENWYNSEEDTQKRIYDEDLHIEETNFGDWKHITVYSINNYKEARSKGLEIWNQEFEKFKTGAIN